MIECSSTPELMPRVRGTISSWCKYIGGHARADGYGRLARQASFEGSVESGRDYSMVDDFIGQSGMLACKSARLARRVGWTGHSCSGARCRTVLGKI